MELVSPAKSVNGRKSEKKRDEIKPKVVSEGIRGGRPSQKAVGIRVYPQAATWVKWSRATETIKNRAWS